MVLPIKRLAFRKPKMIGPWPRLLNDLLATGAAISSLEEMAIPGTEDMLRAAESVSPPTSHPGVGIRKTFVIHAAKVPEIVIAWGKSKPILDLVESYIRLPVAYRGVNLRRDLADGTKIETRLWHKDNEDDRIVKMIVYLNQVNSGSFEYAPKKYQVDGGHRISDEDFNRLVPPNDRIRCIGGLGTVIFADTCSIYHRGGVPEADRLSLFFAYNSIYPRNPEYCGPLN